MNNINAKAQSYISKVKGIPLFYIESGSRLWGFASKDSDYDIRGFHLLDKEKYFDYKSHRDVDEIMDDPFDVVSYDIDKMFSLLSSCNPTVFEWIRSHIIYYNNFPNWEEFQKEVINNFDLKALFFHYLSISKTDILEFKKDKKFTYKRLLYCLRSFLSAELAYKGEVPNLDINNLIAQFSNNDEIIVLTKQAIEIKLAGTEKTEVENKAEVLKLISNKLETMLKLLPSSTGDKLRLKEVLTEYSIKLKQQFY